MEGLIIIVMIILAFRRWVYSKQDENIKLAIKAGLVYISGIFLLFMLWATFSTIEDVYDEEQSRTLAHRLDRVDYAFTRGSIDSLRDYMKWDKNYEDEFEYAWERMEMYECSNYYLVYEKAAERLGGEYTGKAEEYENFLKKMCMDPDYPQNTSYAEYFLQYTGLNAD